MTIAAHTKTQLDTLQCVHVRLASCFHIELCAIVLALSFGCGDMTSTTCVVRTGAARCSGSLDSNVDSSASYCNPVYQSGCNAGERCIFIGNHPGCLPDGTIMENQACLVQDDQCTKGTMCIDDVCRAFCGYGGVKPCASGLCVVNPTMTCSPACDPLVPTCGAGFECYLPIGGNYGDTPGCLLAGSLAEGAPCNQPNDCSTGLTCAIETMPSLGYASCASRCLTASPNCTGTKTCVERHPGDGYGVCL